MSYGSRLQSSAPEPRTVVTGFGQRPAARYCGNKLRFRGNVASRDGKMQGTVCVGTCARANALLALRETCPSQDLAGQVRLQQGQGPGHAAARTAQAQGRQGDGHFLTAGLPWPGSAGRDLTVHPNTRVSPVPPSSGQLSRPWQCLMCWGHSNRPPLSGTPAFQTPRSRSRNHVRWSRGRTFPSPAPRSCHETVLTVTPSSSKP